MITECDFLLSELTKSSYEFQRDIIRTTNKQVINNTNKYTNVIINNFMMYMFVCFNYNMQLKLHVHVHVQ